MPKADKIIKRSQSKLPVSTRKACIALLFRCYQETNMIGCRQKNQMKLIFNFTVEKLMSAWLAVQTMIITCLTRIGLIII